MKHICNICSWEYDADHNCGENIIAHDNKWEEIPEDFKDLFPSGSRENASIF